MKITIEHEGCTVTVTNDAVILFEIVDTLVRPALLAVGFHPDSVAEIFDPEDTDE